MLLRTQLQEDLYHGCISLDFQTQQLAQEKLSAACTSTEFLSRSQAGADAWIWLSYSLQTLLLFLKLLSSPKIIHIVSSKCLCAPKEKKNYSYSTHLSEIKGSDSPVWERVFCSNIPWLHFNDLVSTSESQKAQTEWWDTKVWIWVLTTQ